MIKAIETVYNGYRFRSRLEARWAVFFDTLGIEYEYEPEGFDLGEVGYYLPDFWLPDREIFVEIKGTKTPGDDLMKPEALAREAIPHRAKRVIVCVGAPGERPVLTSMYCQKELDGFSCDHTKCTLRNKGIGWQMCLAVWGWIYFCDPCCLSTHRENKAELCFFPICANDDFQEMMRKYIDVESTQSAYTAARQARFEHGQVGAPSQWA